jgi:hypothetical protein
MRDRWAILGGFAVVLALLTAPVWVNLARGAAAAAPVLERPAGESACVAPAAFMRASHMQLLAEWRDASSVAAFGRTGPDGRAHRISLTGTCLRCHATKARFCDRCHSFAGVAPACWTCHIDPAEIRKGVS